MRKLFKTLQSAVLTAVALSLSCGVMTSCDNDDDKGPAIPDGEDKSVTMNDYWECFYFLPATYDYGNYFFQLRTGEVGMNGLYSYPLNAGDYLLDIDIYTPELDPDHKNPVLPEGRYLPTESHQDNHNMVFTLQNTVAVYNVETLEDGQTRFRYIRFSDGTIDVKHTADGGYILDCNFIAKEDGSKWHFTYQGKLPFEDQSALGDGDWWGFEGNTEFTAQKASFHYYDDSETSGSDNYVLRLFETTNLTPDEIHLNDIGSKLQLSLYAEHQSGIEGTYTVRNSTTPGSCLPGQRFGAMAAQSYVERVRDDYSVRYALLSEGTVSITKAANGSYSVTVNGKTPEGADIKVTYNGEIEDITNKTPIYSTLDSDVTFTPLACTGADYYGDYYGNGTVNYGFSLANNNELVVFEILSQSGDASELPTGTFTVGDSHDAGTLMPGTIDGYDIIPTAYVVYDAEGENIVGYAPVKSGNITITRAGSLYTFTFELYDDAQPANKISGTVTCSVPALTDYTQTDARLHFKPQTTVKTRKALKL